MNSYVHVKCFQLSACHLVISRRVIAIIALIVLFSVGQENGGWLIANLLVCRPFDFLPIAHST